MWTLFSYHSLSLKENEVHIWTINKKEHINKLPDYWKILNRIEKEKASKYRFESDHNCAVVARGILRILLGNYLNKDPKDIKFHKGEYGKPMLNESCKIEFNISHSADSIVMAFTQNNKIGVDIEYTKKEIEVKKIATHFFAKEEIAALLSLKESYHKQAFYNCWTRKEAFIKALGCGLSFPLDQFVVSLDSTKNASLLATKWDEKEKNNWVLKAFEPTKNYIGAFAVKGKVFNTVFWRY